MLLFPIYLEKIDMARLPPKPPAEQTSFTSLTIHVPAGHVVHVYMRDGKPTQVETSDVAHNNRGLLSPDSVRAKIESKDCLLLLIPDAKPEAVKP